MIDIAAPRSVEEWRGASPDMHVPPRVRARVFLRNKGTCQGCTRKLAAGDKHECDHIEPIIAGGENRERNLQTLCSWCHVAKTRREVAAKARTARIFSRHIGIKRAKALIPGSRATNWKHTFYHGWVKRNETA